MPANAFNILIPALASVLVILITVIGQWINSRNDRNLTNQELDLLKKMDPSSKAAEDLTEVIEFRISRWRSKAVQSTLILRRAIPWLILGYTFTLIFGYVTGVSESPRSIADRGLLLSSAVLALGFLGIGLFYLIRYVRQRQAEETATAEMATEGSEMSDAAGTPAAQNGSAGN